MTAEDGERSRLRFARFAYGFLAYLILVITFGAWVRISGSGAGCGNHWPLCNGDVVPRSPGLETVVEFTHRLTSGACGVLAIALLVWSRRIFGPGHRARTASAATLVLVLIEGAIGALLVKAELVTANASVARAVAVAVHLTNTLLLTGACALAAWFAGNADTRASRQERSCWALLGLALLIATGAMGAVTALGDTLFPSGMHGGMLGGVDAAAHFLVRLRAIHPVVAIGTAAYLMWMSVHLSGGTTNMKRAYWCRIIRLLAVSQTALGALNVILSAPGWLQLVHLLAAQAIWVSVVFTWAASRVVCEAGNRTTRDAFEPA